MPPGAMGYFSFSSSGSMKNSRVTFSISSSSSSAMPWLITYAANQFRHLKNISSGRFFLSLFF
jgi:hypothetical protein